MTQRITGPQRYAIEVSRRLLLSKHTFIAVPQEASAEWIPTGSAMVLRGLPLARDGWAWANVSLPIACASRVLWSPTPRAPIRFQRHLVTIHDVAVLEHPEWYARSFRALYGVTLPHLARSAIGVITSSEFSKGRIVQILGVHPDKITVVYGGVDSAFTDVLERARMEVRDRYGLPSRFILALGTLQPRKNINRLIEAWSALPSRTKADWPLVLTGEPGPQFAKQSVPSDGPRDGLRMIGYVPDSELPALYGAATVFAYPSMYEGFGLPPVEAMACGTPVLAGNHGASCEVLGDSAILVDPLSVGAIKEGLLHLLENSETRNALSAAGRIRALEFNWNNAAAQVLDILQHVDAG
jgi:glycosyltransferase involved in cell wall biosynthesis